MCGIVGFTGNQNAAPILLDGLKKLEYRGYDSAGIAVLGEGGHPHGEGQRPHPEPGGQDPGRGRPARLCRHRPHPLGHPRGAHRRQRPPPYEL